MPLSIYIIIALIVAVLALALAMWWSSGQASRAGREGERRVARELARLPRKRYSVLSDILIPAGPAGGTTQIDHIVVSTGGVFVIETKRLSGHICGSEHAQEWTQTTAADGDRSFYNPILQNASHIRALQRLLPDVAPDAFVSVIVFTDAKSLNISADDFIIERPLLPERRIRRTFVPAEVRRHWWQWGSKVLPDDNIVVTPLAGLLKEILRRKAPVIERDDVPEIADEIMRRNDTSRSGRREHKTYVQKVGREVGRDISRGICPRCGGRLEKRKSHYGRFLGCENYPTCRFTSKL